MRRVVKKTGGIMSLKEGDVPGSAFYPDPDNMDPRFVDTCTRTASASGADPQIDGKLHTRLREAGFKKEKVDIKVGGMMYGAEKSEEAQWWGDSWADRCLKSGFHDAVVNGEHATEEVMQQLSNMWRTWGRSEYAWWAIFQTEVICIL